MRFNTFFILNNTDKSETLCWQANKRLEQSLAF